MHRDSTGAVAERVQVPVWSAKRTTTDNELVRTSSNKRRPLLNYSSSCHTVYKIWNVFIVFLLSLLVALLVDMMNEQSNKRRSRDARNNVIFSLILVCGVSRLKKYRLVSGGQDEEGRRRRRRRREKPHTRHKQSEREDVSRTMTGQKL